jgi:hypothetical protein
MKSVLQIIVVNEVKKGVKDGRAWEMQDAECILLDEHGQAKQVGVLPIPKDLRGLVQPGTYTGEFALLPDLKTRRIEARLMSLAPHTVRPSAPAVAPAKG